MSDHKINGSLPSNILEQDDVAHTDSSTGDITLAASTGTPQSTSSAEQAENVTQGNDGYEHHNVTTTVHNLHGNDAKNSVLMGSTSDDTLTGGVRDDVLDGGAGNNMLDGGDGNDVVVAGGQDNHGKNHINGGAGDDILVAGGTKTHGLDDFLQANATLTTSITRNPNFASLTSIANGNVDELGGGVENTFELGTASGNDTIFNFHAASDKLQIHRDLNGSGIQDLETLVQHIHISGNDVMIDLGSNNSVKLVGVDVAHLSASSIVFI